MISSSWKYAEKQVKKKAAGTVTEDQKPIVIACLEAPLS
jgi:hypothetical protein